MELARVEEKLAPVVGAHERAALRAEICELEKELSEMPQVEIPVEHLFGKGCYARTIRIPAGTLIVGKIHKYETIHIISQGDITFLSHDGAKRVQAPHLLTGTPGVKRVGLAHTDTVWTTIHGTDKTNVDEIEEEFIAKTFDDVPGITEEELKLLKGEN
jgi:hypothetical protein